MQIVSPSIWTWVAKSTFYDDNRYPMSASYFIDLEFFKYVCKEQCTLPTKVKRSSLKSHVTYCLRKATIRFQVSFRHNSNDFLKKIDLKWLKRKLSKLKINVFIFLQNVFIFYDHFALWCNLFILLTCKCAGELIRKSKNRKTSPSSES